MASDTLVPARVAIEEDLDVQSAAESLCGDDLISITDLSQTEIRGLLNLAHDVKARPQHYRHALDGKQMVLFFEKASLRTRLTFEAGINTLGGNAIFVDQTKQPLGQRETIPDVARNLERWVNVIVLRTFAHKTVTEMAKHTGVPVVNALSEFEHPCQALADFMALEEHFGTAAGLKFVFVGDGNNVCQSLMLTAAKLGTHFTAAFPEGYAPDAEVVAKAKAIAAETGATITLTHDVDSAVAGADAIYTDVFTSMGQEAEAEVRAKVFKPYQVNEALMAKASKRCVFMHCLPAKRNEEVTDAVMDGPQSIIFDQAENRLHAQKAILLLLMGGAKNLLGAGA